MGKVLHVLHCLGLELTIYPRGWQSNKQTAANMTRAK